MGNAEKITFILVILSAVFLVVTLSLIPKRSLDNEKALSGFQDPRVALAVNYIEKTGQPMQGVRILQELLAEDSTNTEVLHWMGRFALMSGQFDKAEKRFSALLQYDAPDSIRWFALASLDFAYQEQGKYKESLMLLDSLARSIIQQDHLSTRDSVMLLDILAQRNSVEMKLINNH